jgi:hypothetical protein
MSADFVTYNGYTFGDYSDIKVSISMQDDDAGRTTLYLRHKVRVESTIYAESSDTAGMAGGHFKRLRRQLSEKGAALIIRHRAFDINDITVNATASSLQDVAFGPHPRIIEWEPLGPENACHVVWECEFNLPICQGARTFGLMALNYGITYRIDTAGYTTRTISGHLEIALTRSGRSIKDTADAYRDSVIVPPLPNFQREHNWSLSSDKRRADFTIVDTEVRGPNIYPPSVVSIQAMHSANWRRDRGQSAKIPQVIRASIALTKGTPRSQAWEIFKAIVAQRVAGKMVFIEAISVDEQLFGAEMAFSIQYRTLITEPDEAIATAAPYMFSATGIGQPLQTGSWAQWKQSLAVVQSNRGVANLKHDPKDDQIIDPCAAEFRPSQGVESGRIVYTQPPRQNTYLRNEKPPPRKSYTRFEAYLGIDEESPSTSQVPIGEDDIKRGVFNPEAQDADLGGTERSLSLGRFVESAAGNIEVTYRGIAERVGYPIPRPDRLNLNGVALLRRGKGKFLQKFCGNVLGQPVYQAAWNFRYVCANRPGTLDKLNAWRNA